MLVPKWFEEEYGRDKACSGWHVEINKGEYKLIPYGIHRKTKEELKTYESNQQEKNKNEKDGEKENIVSKTASQVGDVVKQIVEAGSSAVKNEK